MDRLLTRAQHARARLEAPSPASPPDATALLTMPLETFATVGGALQVTVPWWPTPLWFAGTVADAEALTGEGYPRATIWTARELLDVLALAPDRASLRTLATAKHLFDGDCSLSSLPSRSDSPSLPSPSSLTRMKRDRERRKKRANQRAREAKEAKEAEGTDDLPGVEGKP